MYRSAKVLAPEEFVVELIAHLRNLQNKKQDPKSLWLEVVNEPGNIIVSASDSDLFECFKERADAAGYKVLEFSNSTGASSSTIYLWRTIFFLLPFLVYWGNRWHLFGDVFER